MATKGPSSGIYYRSSQSMETLGRTTAAHQPPVSWNFGPSGRSPSLWCMPVVHFWISDYKTSLDVNSCTAAYFISFTQCVHRPCSHLCGEFGCAYLCNSCCSCSHPLLSSDCPVWPSTQTSNMSLKVALEYTELKSGNNRVMRFWSSSSTSCKRQCAMRITSGRYETLN